MAIDFHSDLDDLIGTDSVEFGLDEASCVIGQIEDGEVELPEGITAEQYKTVVLDFIEKVIDASDDEEEENEENEE